MLNNKHQIDRLRKIIYAYSYWPRSLDTFKYVRFIKASISNMVRRVIENFLDSSSVNEVIIETIFWKILTGNPGFILLEKVYYTTQYSKAKNLFKVFAFVEKKAGNGNNHHHCVHDMHNLCSFNAINSN